MALSPFSISPDPAVLHVTPPIRDAIQTIQRMIECRQGLATIAADTGMGKSTLLRFLYGSYDARDDVNAQLIPSPRWPSEFAMARFLADNFGQAPARSLYDQVEGLRRAIMAEFVAGRNVVLFIDEAQNLQSTQLELVRSMLNFETDTEKMVQFVLAAQLELRDRLRHRAYRAFKSRIYADVQLEPLSFEDMVMMLRKRCEMAGVPLTFNEAALREIHNMAGGVPRSILVICDRSWTRGVEAGMNEVKREQAAAQS